MIVIDGFRHEISIREAPLSGGEVFDLEKTLVDTFVQEGRDRKEMVFLTTGIGAATPPMAASIATISIPPSTWTGRRVSFEPSRPDGQGWER